MKDPYVYESTDVLINLANIRDIDKLDEFETTFSRIALVDLINNPIKITSVKDIYYIHNKLFKQIYAWAGEKRTINIYKNEVVLNGLSVIYSNYKDIDKDFEIIQKDIDSFQWKTSSKTEIIHKIARIISAIWRVHAFREGNTRTVCMFLYLFMKQLGLKLNVEFVGEHSKYFRNALVLASIDEYSEFEHLEKILLDSVSVKRTINGKTKYQTIRGYNLDKYKYNYHHIVDDDKN